MDGKANVITNDSATYDSLEKDGVMASRKAVVKKSGQGPASDIYRRQQRREEHPQYLHGIKAEFLQLYLNESCYKFNRRFLGFRLFDRLELCACTYRAEFKYRTY